MRDEDKNDECVPETLCDVVVLNQYISLYIYIYIYYILHTNMTLWWYN